MARPPALSDKLGDALQVALVLLPMLAFYVLREANLVAEAPAAAAVVAVYVLYAFLVDNREFPRSRFGWTKHVETSTVEDADGRCASCGEPVETGVERTYAEQFVAFGYPLTTGEWGENVYCTACAAEEFPGDHGGSATTGDDRTEPVTDREDDREPA
jgi:hypothetical protein